MIDSPELDRAPLGVGFLGAGPVTQAIHLPTLARMQNILEVRHIMDVDGSVASTVAARVGARHSTSTSALLGDSDVDIVAVCSPDRFHAAQVIAACRAGKKAVLCEKPFAMNAKEAAEISAVSAETGVPIIVGAMHTFDPGWLTAEKNWGDLPERAHTIRSSIVLPPNARFEDFSTEIIDRPASEIPDYSNMEVVKAVLKTGIMGLAIHDLPLVRRFTPDFGQIEVLQARHVSPFGYVITLRTPSRSIELRAIMSDTWQPEWNFEAIAHDSALRINFTPSYVQAGSAVATLIRESGSDTSVYGPYNHNGYEGEWRQLAELARGTKQAPSAKALIDDLTFALDIADATVRHAAAGHYAASAADEAGASA